ncbi:hypothetical protein AB0H86_03130 [Streptomyces sp. NPDC050997]|uniref:hypothetical protein n=1 Tax=Streptomyces sp. NPDC050997 TaxID=3155519 RepID=UPI0034143958
MGDADALPSPVGSRTAPVTVAATEVVFWSEAVLMIFAALLAPHLPDPGMTKAPPGLLARAGPSSR